MEQVVVADGNPLCREGLSAILSQLFEPAAVLSAADLTGAIRLLSQGAPVSLLVVDLDLPGLDDLEGMQRLRLQYSNLRVVAVAWRDDRNRALSALSAGAHGYIPKTLSSQEMLTAFQTVIEGRVYVPPTVADVTAVVSEAPEPGAGPGSSPGAVLTARQRDVIRLLSAGWSNKQIARSLCIAEGTVKVHMTAAFRTLGVHNRVSAAAAMRNRDIWREEEPLLPGLPARRPTAVIQPLKFPGNGRTQ